MNLTKTYNEVSLLDNFKDRFEYLKLHGSVGFDTFGFDRIFNQKFYHSAEWLRIRNFVIARDNGLDLGCEDYPIKGRILVHHINPISMEDLNTSDQSLLDPNNLICVSDLTHKALHYGSFDLIPTNEVIERKPGDTCPWRTANVYN